ncbi:MAG: PD-(D/E)XK nuclease family protein, partial [Candidatus Aegiribacteria sp.]|nr:PD-(D/E)XK nuclease family protein [Candidatus Aegiribacteria sp.]
MIPAPHSAERVFCSDSTFSIAYSKRMITGYDPETKTFTTGIGDLLNFGWLPDSLVPSSNPLSIGARQRVHSAFQRTMVRNGWQMEVSVNLDLEVMGIMFRIRGRLDLLLESDNALDILEVKTIDGKPDFTNPIRSRRNNALQLYFYTIALSSERDMSPASISSSLVFLSMDSSEPEAHYFPIDLSDHELERSWQDHLSYTAESLMAEDTRKNIQISALGEFRFPYDSPRPGQQEILSDVSNCIESKGYLMMQAPTGTGKTAAVLTGAILQTFPERLTLFFLTAKNTHKLIVHETLRIIIDKGVPMRGIFITARSEVCHRGRPRCFPDDCPYAADFSDKIHKTGIMKELLDLQIIGPDALMKSAEHAGVCAFELGLCLATQCDIVICDYNYVFDPHVFLKRFFLEGNTAEMCSLLIDEAANLPSRARDYYSPEIKLSWIEELLGDVNCPVKRRKLLHPWKEGFREWMILLENSGENEIELPPDTEIPLHTDSWIRQIFELRDPPESLREMFKAIIDFSKISGVSDNRFHLLIRRENDDHILQWFCTDPSLFLRERLESCHSSIAFSATLTPFEHFRYILGFPDNNKTVSRKIAWPFPRENLGVWINTEIDTRYKSRKLSASLLSRRITEIYSAMPGTWLIFFPSYVYLELIADYLKDSSVPLLIQTRGMSREDRAGFIERIESENQLVLTVSGGVFSEGIDLRSENLLGAIIIGPSLPGLNLRMKLLSESYSHRGWDAFMHTWAIPGIVRVIQAAGRLIRNRSERKILVLIGRRFTRHPYLGLLPEHWFRDGSIQL